ncbi:uncharacterized protein N7459_004739 [Penicillium hispanicum]|uniref:uncharacterized protein n=1 Tax=Penicillium hispanicum TaxID=1080232 RepID=UPI0025418B37|nr:uncharacterized protein N7459_004739 [Penicillium hispanicum]KAJ5584939.1 hypothetical protein N7459_004739 [Penicillium hispanicum]
MPPYPRPVSPLTLETCLAPTPEIDDDNLLGSDDELDDTARAAKWEQIEKLAESYLQGNPLFILSASLRGPFEKKWKNPWKKNRKICTSLDASTTKTKSNNSARGTERVIQETDPRNPQYREDLSAVSHGTTAKSISGSGANVLAASLARDRSKAPAFAPRSSQKRTAQRIARDEQSQASPRTAKKQKEDSSWATDEHTIVQDGPVDWLKKDRKRMNFTKFEPPSSPTPKGGSRLLENGFRSVSRAVEVRITNSPSRLRTPGASSHGDERRVESDVTSSPQAVRSPVHVPEAVSSVDKGSPSKQQSSSGCEDRAGSSFRVIASTSQLPRFEYRCRHQHESSSQAELKSPDHADTNQLIPAGPTEENDVDAFAGIAEDQNTDGIGANDSRQANDTPVEDGLADTREGSPEAEDDPMDVENDALEAEDAWTEGSINNEKANQQMQLSKSLRFANDGNAPYYRSTHFQPEQDTYGHLPSAQEVPAPLGVSDRIPSLHSTAVPKANTEDNDTQLSTQAALLHAQKSFQDDLDSPENELSMTPEQYRAMAGVGNDSLLAHETPLYRPDTSERALPRSFKQSDKDRVQATSTQCMIDAASPFAFSTEKKHTTFRSISPRKTSPQKREQAINADTASHSFSSPSPSPDHAYTKAQSDAGDSSPRPDIQQAAQVPTPHSVTQATTLPLTLSGSTPPTAQDGQGGLIEARSFNLSQAIADAGSWLQQSFI